VPEQPATEFARNKERIVRDSGKSLSGTFKRVRAAVAQFAQGHERDAVLKGLDDVGNRITVLGVAVNGLISRAASMISPSPLRVSSANSSARASPIRRTAA